MSEQTLNEWMLIHQAKGRREQIISSMADTVKALQGDIGIDTRKYLEIYMLELEEELTHLGLN